MTKKISSCAKFILFLSRHFIGFHPLAVLLTFFARDHEVCYGPNIVCRIQNIQMNIVKIRDVSRPIQISHKCFPTL